MQNYNVIKFIIWISKINSKANLLPSMMMMMIVIVMMLLSMDHLAVCSRHIHDHRFEFDDELGIGNHNAIWSAHIVQNQENVSEVVIGILLLLPQLGQVGGLVK